MRLPRILIDGVETPAEHAQISVTDDGLLRGDGVFEVLRVYRGTAFAVQDHLDRLCRSAAGLRLPVSVEAASADISALERIAVELDATIRLVVTRGGRRIAMLEEITRFPKSVSLATVTFTPVQVLQGLKTLSYAANVLANRLANERGADQALLISPSGDVLEGPNFSFFVAFEGDDFLTTPPLSTGILDSITRRRLVGIVPVREASIDVQRLSRAREAFVASTVREILPVNRIDDDALPTSGGPLTDLASNQFARHVACATRTKRVPDASLLK